MPSSGRWLDNAVILRSRRRRRIPRSEAGVFGKQTRVDALSSKTFCQSKVNRFFPIFLFGNTPKRKISGKKEKTLGSAVIFRRQKDETLNTMRTASTSAMRCVVCCAGLVLLRNETNYIAHSGCRTPRHSHIVSIPQATGFNCQPQRVFFFPAGFLLTAGKRKIGRASCRERVCLYV